MTGDDDEKIPKFNARLAKEFAIKELGKVKNFFGIEVAQFEEDIIISQQKYIYDLLQET